MTVAETLQLLTAITIAGGFFLSMKSTSFNELRTLYDAMRREFDEYKKDSAAKENEYEKKVDNLIRQNERFKKYISVLIRQLEKNNITPDSMSDEE